MEMSMSCRKQANRQTFLNHSRRLNTSLEETGHLCFPLRGLTNTLETCTRFISHFLKHPYTSVLIKIHLKIYRNIIFQYFLCKISFIIFTTEKFIQEKSLKKYICHVSVSKHILQIESIFFIYFNHYYNAPKLTKPFVYIMFYFI